MLGSILMQVSMGVASYCGARPAVFSTVWLGSPLGWYTLLSGEGFHSHQEYKEDWLPNLVLQRGAQVRSVSSYTINTLNLGSKEGAAFQSFHPNVLLTARRQASLEEISTFHLLLKQGHLEDNFCHSLTQHNFLWHPKLHLLTFTFSKLLLQRTFLVTGTVPRNENFDETQSTSGSKCTAGKRWWSLLKLQVLT